MPPPPTPADTTILGAVRALDPRSDIERAVEGLDGLAIAGGRSDERAVDRLNDLPRTSPARTPPVRARRGTGRVSLVERQRQHTARTIAGRRRTVPGAPCRTSPRRPSRSRRPGRGVGDDARGCSSRNFLWRFARAARAFRRVFGPHCERMRAAEHAPRGPFSVSRASSRPRGDRRAWRRRSRRAPSRKPCLILERENHYSRRERVAPRASFCAAVPWLLRSAVV